MAHLDLLSRSRRGAAAYRLTSIVPLAPLDRPLSICFRCRSPVLDVSWVKVRESGLSAAAVRAFRPRRFARYPPQGRRTCVARADNSFASRLPKATRHARCHPIGSEGRGGDVCIHRPAVFRSNKSSSLCFFFAPGSQCLPWSPCVVRSPLSAPPPLPGDVFYFFWCFLILRRAYSEILTLDDVAATVCNDSRVRGNFFIYPRINTRR